MSGAHTKASAYDRVLSGLVMHLVVIGGSDAGISAALRAQEREPGAEITVSVVDDHPNFSICGLPDFLAAKHPTGVLSLIAPSFLV